jgi:hypothetical protein
LAQMMPTQLISSAHLKKTVPRHRKRFAAMTRICELTHTRICCVAI